MAILWRKELEIDGATIDEDHKFLINLINNYELALHIKSKQKLVELSLKTLKHYTIQHFKREEELQRLSFYPFAQAHIHEHQDLIKTLDNITKMASEKAPEKISELLKDWLINHIIQSDLRMKPYIKPNQWFQCIQ